MSNPMIDALDRRVLLAAFATLNARGTLSVAGTAAADQIVVDRSASQVRARLNGQTLNFPAAAVKRIWANGFGGNDAIENRTTLPSTLLGEGGRDTLVGGSNADSLDGGGGVDTLRSGRGADTLFPGIEGDLIDYSDEPAGGFSAGDDDYGLTDFSISTPSGQSDLVQQPARNLRLLASPGNDRIFTERNNSILLVDGGGGNDHILGGARPTQPGDPGPTLVGGGGNDTIGASEDLVTDAVLGASGNDTIYDELGYRFVDAGSGYDKLFLARSIAPDYQIGPGVEYFEKTEEGTGVVFGNELNNRIIVTGGATAIQGGGGDDYISVTSGNPTNTSIFGEAGNDTLVGGDGNDSLDGGGGVNTFRTGTGQDIVVSTGDGDLLDYSSDISGSYGIGQDEEGQSDFVITTPSGNDVIRRPIQLLRFLGTDGNDGIFISDNDSFSMVDGGRGNDGVDGGADQFRGMTIAGGRGNDTLRGNEDFQIAAMHGGPGDDLFLDEISYFIDGGTGYDRVELINQIARNPYRLGPGVDELRVPPVGGAPRLIIGNELDNRIFVDREFDTVRGEGGDDTILAAGGDILGNAGNDSLVGGTGDNRIFGGSDNDTLVGGAGRDLLHGQGGNDFIDAFDGEIDTLDGGTGFDRARRDKAAGIVDSVSNVEQFV